MVKHSSILILAMFLVGCFFFLGLEQTQSPPKNEKRCALSFAVVCAEDVQQGNIIRADQLDERGFSTSAVPVGSLQRIDEVAGSRARRNLQRNSFVSFRDVDPGTQRQPVSAYRAISDIREGEELSIANSELIKSQTVNLPQTYLRPSYIGIRTVHAIRAIKCGAFLSFDDTDLPEGSLAGSPQKQIQVSAKPVKTISEEDKLRLSREYLRTIPRNTQNRSTKNLDHGQIEGI